MGTTMSVVTVTPEANKHLSQTIIDNEVKGVSLSVEGGGCAGFSYKWNLIDTYPNDTQERDIVSLEKGFLQLQMEAGEHRSDNDEHRHAQHHPPPPR